MSRQHAPLYFSPHCLRRILVGPLFRPVFDHSVDRLPRTIQQHPKRITAAVAAILLTGGGGAFAVASFAPDPAELPVRMVSYPVESLAENLVLGELEAPGFSLFRSEQVRSSDTPESLLQRMGVADPAAAAFMPGDPPLRPKVLGRTRRTRPG